MSTDKRKVSDILDQTARAYGDQPALKVKRNGLWQSTTWREYRERARLVGRGLIALGLKRRRDAGTKPFTVMSCDNIPHNGVVARNAVAGVARLWDKGLADWIVVNAACRGQGLARRLYAELAAVARKAGHTELVCEVNLDPPNPVSDAFHAALGFRELGRGSPYAGKIVRYLACGLT